MTEAKKRSSWNLGLQWSEEVRKKISEKMKGKIPWNKGLPWSDEMKKKISNARKGVIADGNLQK